MSQQPDGMECGQAAILTLGWSCNNEPFQYVLPIVTDNPGMTADQLCADAVQAAEDSIVPDLQPCMSSGAFLTFIQATGVVPGKIPFRKGYVPTDFPGTSTANPLPTNTAALGVIYQDTEDVTPGARIRLAKTFITGLARLDVVGNDITPGLRTNILQLVNDMQGGWPTITSGGFNWYRMLDVPKPATNSTPVKRLLITEVRGGIFTQKRRLVPRNS
jgi:hypothetical protein